MSLPLIPLAPSGPTAARRALLARRIRLLVAATITYNVIEAIAAITAGSIASSTALIGFGLDSIIEVASAAAVAWQFAGRDPEAREKVALRVIALSFFALAGYVTVEAVRALLGAAEAEHSTAGLVLAGLSVVVMPVLSAAQRRAGRELGSRSAVADSKQTLLCTYLSAVLLVGLALNSLFGWSWADPFAALVIAGVAMKEGREAWRGQACCAVPATGSIADADPATRASGTSTAGERDACGCEPGCSCCAKELARFPADAATDAAVDEPLIVHSRSQRPTEDTQRSPRD
jgi:Co/Zn/Cd efflux system component